MLEIKNIITHNLTLFRFILFFCACSYAVILYYWLRPNTLQVKNGIMAIIVQFWLGFLLDAQLVKFGFWQYFPMNFMALGVPIDLHVAWALLWGLGICWLSDKWPGKHARLAKFFIYISAWTFLTLFFDVMMVDWMIFLKNYSVYWWIADIIILTSIQGLTLWFYHSINYSRRMLISPYIRSLIYLSFFVTLFFIYIPQQIFILIQYFGVKVRVYQLSELAYIFIFVAVIIGGWATYEFARKGGGTPIPWDAPQFLVTSGPYLFMSNPMQFSGILLTIAVFLFNIHWFNFVYLIDVILVVWLVFERIELMQLKKEYGNYFERYRSSVPPWKILLRPPLIDKSFKPILFIDKECSICQIFAQQLGKNVEIKGLNEISSEGHPHLEYLVSSKTTVILVEPKIHRNDCQTEFLYSIRGRAILRICGYMPIPVCLIAAWEGIPGFPLLADFCYKFFAKIRRYI